MEISASASVSWLRGLWNWSSPSTSAPSAANVQWSGLDLGGLRGPKAGVPTATLTKWNLRRAPLSEGDLCGLNGMFLPLAETDSQAAAAGDPRPSIQALYATHDGYVQAVTDYVNELVRGCYLLPQGR